MKDIYIVFSSTPYRIGRMIRKITAEPFNHVSLALNEELTEMYGFARRYNRLPLYGGFVKESLSRYHPKGIASQIKVCKLPVTQEQYDSLQTKLQDMYAQKDKYLYNHLSILSVPFRRWIKARDAYICVEFVVDILSQLGVVPNRYYSVCGLLQQLSDYVYYEGPMPLPQQEDEAYFSKKPIPHPTLTTFRNLFALLGRI